MIKMNFTLDRIENNSVAVLIDENGKKFDVCVDLLPNERSSGSIYNFDGNTYIYNEKETIARRNQNSDKLKKLMNKEVVCSYEAPQVEVIEVEVEKGFAVSTEGLDGEENL